MDMMKRQIGMIFCTLLHVAVTAQADFALGITPGLNFSKFATENSEVSGTARPSIGLYIEYGKMKVLSHVLSGAISMRGERQDQTIFNLEANFLDVEATSHFHFLEVVSVGAGLGYFMGLNARRGTSRLEESISADTPEDRWVVPIEVGLDFFRNSRVNFIYSISLSNSFDNMALSFQFPIWSSNREKRNKVSRRSAARSHIAQLAERPLLVRLNTYSPPVPENSDEKFVKKRTETLKAMQQKNREIQDAFKYNYDFGEVYFFESYQSKQILNGDFSVLRDANSELISQEKYPKDGSFYVAEFSHLEPDSGKYWMNSRLVPAENGGQKILNHYGSYDSGITYFSLMIKDSAFRKLENPFPNHVRCLKRSLIKAPESFLFAFPLLSYNALDFNSAVIRLNNKLHRYCRKN